MILIYQKLISPWTPASCRFTPSCSDYALGAFKKHGIRKGFKLTLFRITSCHPWGGSGYDPIP